MFMTSTHCYRFVFLVWHVIHGVVGAALHIVAECNKDVTLPCKVLRIYKSKWEQMSPGTRKNYGVEKLSGAQECVIGESSIELKEHDYSREPNESLETSNDTWHSLMLRNTTSYSSGTYKCLLKTPIKKYNQSSTVTLKVIDCPEEPQDAKHKKYRTELLLLCSLGVFYLLLIFLACTCLKGKSSTDYHKSRKKYIDSRLCHTNTC